MFSSLRKLPLSIAFATLTIVALANAVPAHADSYSVTVVAHTQSENFYGIDDGGDFTINISDQAQNFAVCGSIQLNPRYETILFGQSQQSSRPSRPRLHGTTAPTAVPSFPPDWMF
jgi:hypothetical protein